MNTDIDKQFSEKFEKCDGYMCGHETTDDHYVIWDDEIKSFLHQIYSQAKAEQREEIINLLPLAEEGGWHKDYTIQERLKSLDKISAYLSNKNDDVSTKEEKFIQSLNEEKV